VRNFLVTSEAVPGDTVYAMTKALFTNLDQMVAAHSAAKSISAADAPKDLPVPLHPGAERYYREAGLLK
jgi:TRAP transporter TAXI family solute receptor